MITCKYGGECHMCDCCTNMDVLAACEGTEPERDIEFAMSAPEDFILSIPYDMLKQLLETNEGRRAVDKYINANLLEYANWLEGGVIRGAKQTA